ncbi:FAD-dependent oxidoreductase [bacterium]|nr:FAD-dependent oxidoreductase [bacterium]
MKFVIIGGDAAGMSAASRAKRNCPDLEVTVLEKSNDVSYSACGMPYNIADPTRSIEDLVVRSAEVFRNKQGINLLTRHLVDKIDVHKKEVSGIADQKNPFSITYDKLLIATGASSVVPNLPGFDLPGVFGLKGLEDGRKIKEFITKNRVTKVTIVGMGYIALEMAEALITRDIAVELIKPRSQFLPWLDENLSQIVLRELKQNNVKLHLGSLIERITSITDKKKPNGSLRIEREETEIITDMIITAIGVTPNSMIAGRAGLKLGAKHEIVVDRKMKTSCDDIYAAGDCADSFHNVTGKKTYLPLALRANRGGWVAADNICGREVEAPGISGTSVFKVFDLEVARTGLNMEQALENGYTPAGVYIKTQSRAHAHPGSSVIHLHMVGDRSTGKLLGVQMVGKEGVAHRINAVAIALQSGMSVRQFYKSDLAYAPPFSPVWDPLLTTANQLLKKLA